MEHDQITKAMLLSLNCARGEATTYAVLNFVSRSTNYLIVLLQEPWLNSNKEPPPMAGFDMFIPTPHSPKCATYIRKSAGLRPTLAFNEGDCFLGIRLSPEPPPRQTTETQPRERGGREERDGKGNENGNGNRNKGEINKINTKKDGKRRERRQNRTPTPNTNTINPAPPQFTVYNLYSPGRQQAVCHLFHGFQPDRNALICGDFNSHHRMWYGNKASLHQKHLSGESGLAEGLVDNILRLSLQMHNKPGLYTHFPRNGSSPSVVDLVFTRGEAEIRSWTLGDDFGSDHKSTHLHLALRPSPTMPRLAWNKTDWSLLVEEVTAAGLDFRNLTSPQEVERAATNLTTALHSAIGAAVPELKPGRGRRIRGWWTKELDNLSKEVKSLQQRARREPENTDVTEKARKMRNHRRNEIRMARQSYLMLKLQTTSPTEVWKVLRDSKPAHTKGIPDLAGQASFSGKCRVLRNALFPPPTPGSDIPPLKSPLTDLTNEFKEITPTEISQALKKCNRQSACGADRIPYTVIERVHQALPNLLTRLFTASLETGHFPSKWKHANCVVIPKGGNRDPHTPKAYRPISLLNNISKVMEKLVARRIARAALRTGALSTTQFGAIENRSAVDALFAITHPASATLETPNAKRGGKAPRLDRPTLLANDIQGAFNNTDPARLVRIMRTRSLPSYLANWTASFTTSRTMGFCFDNSAEEAQPYDSGLPQGSPVSPVLFLIYAQAMLEAPKYLKDEDVSYLDDDGALQLATSQAHAVRRLQERMALRLERGGMLNLPYDTAKSGLVHFWPRRNNQRPEDPSGQPPVSLSGTVVRPSKSIKHLGVHLDDTLSFHTHADKAAATGYKCLGQLAALRHRHKGLSTYTALHLIKTAFIPKMLWASPVWWTGSQHVLTRLEPTYHRALRCATGLPDFTPLRKLFVIARMPPLQCLLDNLSARYAAGLLFGPDDHPLNRYVRPELEGPRGRRISRRWMHEMRQKEEAVHYPTLCKPLSLVARLLEEETYWRMFVYLVLYLVPSSPSLSQNPKPIPNPTPTPNTPPRPHPAPKKKKPERKPRKPDCTPG